MPWWLSESPVCIQTLQDRESSQRAKFDGEWTKPRETDPVVRVEAAATAPLPQFCKPPVLDMQPDCSAPATLAPAATGNLVRQQPQNEKPAPPGLPRMSSLKALIICLGLNDAGANERSVAQNGGTMPLPQAGS
jgi:hypothetical protein